MDIVKYNPKQVKKIIRKITNVLEKGGLVIYPTETCYGVAVDATNENAVAKLLKYKRRPEGKAVSIAVNSISMAEKYVKLNPTAVNIYEKFLPGPVTVVSEAKPATKIAEGLAAENNTLGIRIPDFAFALQLITIFGKPVTATSANSAGKKTPYTVDDVFDNLNATQKKLIDLVIDYGELPRNPPSTVIDTTRQQMQILRKGRTSFGKIVYTEKIESEAQMRKEGAKLIAKYKNLLADNALLIMFNADLGAGKTQFTKGMAQELGIKDIVDSPTFTLVKEYDFEYSQVKGRLVHMDAWRIENLGELDQLGIKDNLKPGNVIAVEWAGMAEDYFKKLAKHKQLLTVAVEINYIDQDTRELRISE